jgi:dihydrolipoamide dehydrogenase
VVDGFVEQALKSSPRSLVVTHAVISKDGDEQTLTAERMFVAIGRGPRTEGFGFEEAGVKLDRGFIVVDESFATSADGVYAIGDAIVVPDADWPHPQLAHVAFLEGQKVAEVIAGEDPAPVDYRNIPHVIYCQPEVAAVGLTEDKAREAGHDVVTAKYNFAANARALMLGGGQGFIKTVTAADGAVLGVHIVGMTDYMWDAGIPLHVRLLYPEQRPDAEVDQVRRTEVLHDRERRRR